MIQILAGEKGEGKTKRLIDMANSSAKTAKGDVIFIDDDKRHMYDLNYKIRLIETNGFIMYDQKVFFGFICGILSQNRDIEKIYIDGLKNIIKSLPTEDLVQFIESVEKLSDSASVDFTIIVSGLPESFPEKNKGSNGLIRKRR